MVNTHPMRFLLATFVLLLALGAHAQSADSSSEVRMDGVVVRSSGYGVLNEEDLKGQGSKTLAEILRTVPGIDVSSSGGAGQPTSVFIRGAKSEHTLVLIDGFEANDPTSTARAFDFSSLTAENLERVEIYKGAQSARFGADAIGGVINIITKKGRIPAERSASYEGGSYQTHRLSGRVSGQIEKFDYAFGVSHLNSEGFSASQGAPNEERDPMSRSTISSRLGWKFSETENFDFNLRLIEAATKLDVSGGPQGDDPNYDSRSRQYVGNAKFESSAFQNRLRSSYQAGFGSVRRQYDNDPDPIQTQNYHETFRSQLMRFETSQKVALSESSEVEMLIQYREEAASSDQLLNGVQSSLARVDQSVFGQAFLYRWAPDTWVIESALRRDDVSIGDATEWNGSLSATHSWATTVLRVNAGTGFKPPSLFQIYSRFGSRGLKSERAINVDASVEQKIGDMSLISLSYFQTRFENMIDFDFVTSLYSNVARAKTEGLEAQVSFSPYSQWIVSLATKLMKTRDEVSGLELLRRPRVSTTAGLEWRDEEGGLVAELQARFFGDRDDIDPLSFDRTRLPSYAVWSSRLRYRFTPGWECSLRVENISNQSYQEIAGYRTSARAYYAGISAEF